MKRRSSKTSSRSSRTQRRRIVSRIPGHVGSVLGVYDLMRDRRVPWTRKAVVLAATAYLFY